MPTHSPLPWHQGPHYKTDIDSRTGRVAECGLLNTPQGIADAAFIVRAVNSHAALLEAARLTVLHFKRTHASGAFQDDDEHEAWTALDKAIRLAEGGSDDQ